MCNNKKCLEYDTLHDMNHKFGNGELSHDMKGQYDMYCKKKIEKLGCMIDHAS